MAWVRYWLCCVKAGMLLSKIAKAEKDKNYDLVKKLMCEMQAAINEKAGILKLKGF